MSLIVSAFGCVYSLIHARAAAQAANPVADDTAKWITAFYATTLFTNLFATMLLAYRIWSIDKRLAHVNSRDSQLRSLVKVILDSGALYTVTLIISLSFFLKSSPAQFICVDTVGSRCSTRVGTIC